MSNLLNKNDININEMAADIVFMHFGGGGHRYITSFAPNYLSQSTVIYDNLSDRHQINDQQAFDDSIRLKNQLFTFEARSSTTESYPDYKSIFIRIDNHKQKTQNNSYSYFLEGILLF